MKNILEYGVLACFLMASAVQAECQRDCVTLTKQGDKLFVTVIGKNGQLLEMKTIVGMQQALMDDGITTELYSSVQNLLSDNHPLLESTNEDGGTAPNPGQGVGQDRIKQVILSSSEVVMTDGTVTFITIIGWFDTFTGSYIETEVVVRRVKPPEDPKEEKPF